MPSTYAHYRMGCEVREKISGGAKDAVEKYPSLYLTGLHGPDILFYYRPLMANRTSSIGYDTHGRPGRFFFENAANVLKAHESDARYLSYACGLVCHFALDVTCHGYIDEKIEASGATHTEIEVEFDRMLMVKDGLDPISHRLADHIEPSVENASVIQPFFSETDSRHIRKALKGMIFYNNLLLAPSMGKRRMINAILKLTGNYKEMHGLVVSLEPSAICADSTEKLWELYGQARHTAVRLLENYMDYLEGQGELDPLYDRTFGSKLL